MINKQSTKGPLIVLGEGRSDFVKICGGTSGCKMSHFGPSKSEKVIYHRFFGSENGNLAPILTKFGIFRWYLAEIFYPDTKMPTSVRTSVLLASSIFAERQLVSACNNPPSVLPTREF
jgi:hypothetical protein